MTTLIVFVFRLAVLAVFTFGFVVLFEHGPQGFPENAKGEADKLVAYLGSLKEKKNEPAPPAVAPTAAPVPEATPVPTPVATPPPVAAPTPTPAPRKSSIGAFEELQKRPIGEGMDAPLQGLPTSTPSH